MKYPCPGQMGLVLRDDIREGGIDIRVPGVMYDRIRNLVI